MTTLRHGVRYPADSTLAPADQQLRARHTLARWARDVAPEGDYAARLRIVSTDDGGTGYEASLSSTDGGLPAAEAIRVTPFKDERDFGGGP